MMSKASYMIQDSVRRMYGLVTDLHNPSTFFVRGRVPFPQGVAAVAQLFANKRPADVYAHKYFIEKQSDPSQPSPQLHLTEELHGIMKVMAGLRYMRDDTTKLDSTMMFVSDFDVDAKALMLASPDEDQNAYKMKKEDEQQQRAPAEEEEEEDPVGMKMKTGIELPPLPGINRELLKAANPIDPAELRKRPQRQPPPGTPIPASIQRRGGSAKYSSSSTSNTTSGGTSKRSSRRGDAYQPSKFPSPEQSSSGREANNRFFALFYPNHLNAADAEAEVPDPSHFTPPMREVCGGYTVLYNPIEVNEVAFEEVLRKLHNEKRAVMAIVVPSRHSYRHVQVWADAFPEARILSSGPIPIAEGASQKGADSSSSSSSSSSQTSSAGYQVMTDGSMGLEFPEVDEAELAAAAPQQQQPSSHHEDGGEDADPAEVLWKHREAVALPPQSFVGLRREDAHRLQLLSSLTQREGSGADVLERVELTPRIELLRVAGDAAADEYVLYDAQAAALACTDVYHGEYSDLDPVNSWMCRVWFKFMKRGNHKRTDIAPLYKIKQANVGELQSSIDAITRQRYIRYVVSAHGTPPLVEDAANCLRRQWGIPPLRGMERWSRRDVRR